MFFALISAVAWSLFDLARKHLTASVAPLVLSFWLAACVAPVYLLVWLFSGATAPAAGYWLPGCISLLAAAVASFSFIKALASGEMARLIPVLSLTPVFASVFSWLLLNETIRAGQGVAIVTIVVAIFLLQGGAKLLRDPSHAGPGFALMLLVSVCWGVGAVFDKWALQSAPISFHGTFQSGGTALLTYLAYLLLEVRKQQAPAFPVFTAPLPFLLMAVAVFAVAVSCQWMAITQIHPGVVETIKRGTGILGAALWGVWLFNESVSRWQLLLMAVIVAATAWLTLS
ncbi:MAG: hypothetical protein CMI02_19015 [Oceanospirillaceae bacterium]|nr:hypothetical protein [Oceanospirillaceae bacterium]MBT14120.1 hypothetical protein [Oceanospirillaceae bacterium]|tara:strand:+ start:29196 stop:30053 length:858 start_codon:yes stop_codon:yes gene_type:complete